MRFSIVDLEATCWDGLPEFQREHSEVIEVGAVGFVEGKIATHIFDTIIQPIKQPMLSKYCTDLTGITQQQVEAAPLAPAAYREFLAWLSASDLLGGTLVAWGNYDGRKLREEMKLHRIRFPFASYINLKTAFAAYVGGRPMGLSRAIENLGWKFEGRHHSGICDAQNTFRIFSLLKEKAKHVLVLDKF